MDMSAPLWSMSRMDGGDAHGQIFTTKDACDQADFAQNRPARAKIASAPLKIDLRRVKIDLRRVKIDLRRVKIDLRRVKIDLRRPKFELRRRFLTCDASKSSCNAFFRLATDFRAFCRLYSCFQAQP
jgi:hypothetical protein